MFVLLSGPAVNLILYAILTVCKIGGLLPVFNLAEGLFNLLPYSMLDGGAVLNLIAEGSTHEHCLQSVYFVIKLVTSAIIAIIMLNVWIL